MKGESVPGATCDPVSLITLDNPGGILSLALARGPKDGVRSPGLATPPRH